MKTKSERLRDMAMLVDTLALSLEDEIVEIVVPTGNDINTIVLRAALFRAHARLMEAKIGIKDAESYAYIAERHGGREK